MSTVNELAWKFGVPFGSEVQNNLFQTSTTPAYQMAHDLYATNINRGRDHGLQPYLYYADKCKTFDSTKYPIKTWEDLERATGPYGPLMTPHDVYVLRTLYA